MEHLIDFRFCNYCEDKETMGGDDPCHECISNPSREGSDRPLYFRKRKEVSDDDLENLHNSR